MNWSRGGTTRQLGSETGDLRLPRTVYRLAQQADNLSLRILDLGVITAAWLLAYVAGFEGRIPIGTTEQGLWLLGLPVLIQIVVNRVAGLYGPVWRYASVEEAVRVIAAVGAGALLSTVSLAALSTVTDTTLPVFTTPPVAVLLMLLGCGGIRFQSRLFALERQRTRQLGQVRALIVGAGDAGAALAYELSHTEAGKDVRVVGFVDDDPDLAKRSVRGLPVLGTDRRARAALQGPRDRRVLIALPDAGGEHAKTIVGRALRTDAQVKVLPRASERIGGPLLRSLRDLDLTDLLGREHAPVDSHRDRRVPRRCNGPGHRRRRLDRQRDRPPGRALQARAPAPPRP